MASGEKYCCTMHRLFFQKFKVAIQKITDTFSTNTEFEAHAGHDIPSDKTKHRPIYLDSVMHKKGSILYIVYLHKKRKLLYKTTTTP